MQAADVNGLGVGTDPRARRLIDDAQMTRFVKKIMVFSSGGAFLDGYVLSIIGVALVQLTPALGLTPAQGTARAGS